MVVLLRFNQPVRPADVAAHLTASLERHDWSAPPALTPEEQDRLMALDPNASRAFAQKVEATRQIAAGGPAVSLRLTTNWDRERFPQSPDLVAFETVTPVRPESWVKLVLDRRCHRQPGRATPREAQTYTIQAEPAFFINDFYCTAQCDGDGSQPARSPASLSACRTSQRRFVRLTSRPAIRP